METIAKGVHRVGVGYVNAYIVDGDQGVPLSECIRISRHVEHNLDRDKEDFSLEVTWVIHLVSFVTLVLVFAAIYRVLPVVRVRRGSRPRPPSPMRCARR